MPHSSQIRRIPLAKGLRAFGDGFVSVLLPLYLIELGLGPLEVGAITAGTLLGSGVLTLAIGLCAHRFRLRSLLLFATFMMAATGLSFAVVTQFWPLLLIAVVGTLNPSSGDVSVFLPLEQAAVWSERWWPRSVRWRRDCPVCWSTQRCCRCAPRCS